MPDARSLRLSTLPPAGKVLLTAFIALVGGGYLSALANLYHQHHMKDAAPALSFRDLVLNFHGGQLEERPTSTTSPSTDAGEVPPKMLKMVLPGGKMRDELEDGGEPAVRALIAWLKAGAEASTFEQTGLVEPGDPSPKAVLSENCVECHGPYGERDDAPFAGEDEIATYDLVMPYAVSAGDAGSGTAGSAPTASRASSRYVRPQSVSHLALVTHIHMLSIPVFTLILGGLVLLTGLPGVIRGPLAVTPMLALLFDFSSWWIARTIEPATYVIVAAGAAYGFGLAAQIAAVLSSMWLGRRPRPIR
jgi:hypothetical protein